MARLVVMRRRPALQLMLLELMKVGCRWVGAAAPATSQRLCFERKVSSVVLLSSVGLEGGVSGGSSVTTRPARVVGGHLDASIVVVLGTESISAVLVFLPPLVKRWSVVFVLWSLLLLASGAALRQLSFVVPRCLRVGLRSWASRLRRCCQDPLLRVASKSRSTPLWTLSFSPRLP
jgi:hypothetical protein